MHFALKPEHLGAVLSASLETEGLDDGQLELPFPEEG